MRESFSKRTKSPAASSSATSKRPSKLSRGATAKAPPRQATAVTSGPLKTPVKSSSGAVTQKKETLTKKTVGVRPDKKSARLSSSVEIPKKLPTKPTTTSAKPVKKAAKPKVEIQTKPSLRSRQGAKSVHTPARIPRQQTATQALRAFERAIKAFNLRQFSEAKELFEALQQRYHQEVEIISRSQTYIQVCNVRLAGNRSLPRNADDFYDQGVVALNTGNFPQARSFFEKALKLRPDDSHTLYSLAATHAQTGSTDQALTYLRQAVQRQPRLRQRALQDTDFSALKDDRRFLELLGVTSPFDLLEARRDLS